MKKVKLRKRTRGKLYFQHLPWIPLRYYSVRGRVKFKAAYEDGYIGHFGSFKMVSLDDIEGYRNK